MLETYIPVLVTDKVELPVHTADLVTTVWLLVYTSAISMNLLQR